MEDRERAVLVSIRMHVTVCAYALLVIAACAIVGLAVAVVG